MDPLSPLPLECLQHILDILSQQNDTPTLAALLGVNKTIAAITLPYLYADPFRPSLHVVLGKTKPRGPTRTNPVLTRMLLGHLAVDSLTSMLSSVLLYDPSKGKAKNKSKNMKNTQGNHSSSLSPPPLDYLGHIRHLNMDRWVIDIDRLWPCKRSYHSGKIPPPREIMELVQWDEFERMCNLARILPTYLSSFDRDWLLRQHFLVMLFREATWALSNPILEQLQSLTIPISLIDKYLGAVDRLGRLESVRFMMDELFDYPPAYIWNPALEEFLFMTDDLKRAAMDSMVRFVKEHARLFPGQLAGGATFIDGTFWENGSKVFPREVQLDIARCLPPLRDVTTVTDENWLRFEAHVKSMDLRTVENIVSRNKGIELLHGLDLDDGDERPFLQRCRGLKSLEMAARGPGSFKWAVEEKRRALYRLPGINTTPTTDSGVSDGKVTSPRTLALLQQGLVPLAKISLTENDTALTNECNDVTYAFSQTLTHLSVLTTTSSSTSMLVLGETWADLPMLTHLSLGATWDRVEIDKRLLGRRCPNLKSVIIFDSTSTYQCSSIITSPPVNLPHLENLELIGWTALAFHPATLDSTPNLVTLRLEVGPKMGNLHNEVTYIPPVDELDRSFGIQNGGALAASSFQQEAPDDGQSIRPRWFWEWKLPHLTSLYLSAEFAFRFEFKMLYGCPALETLEIRVNAFTHYREIFLHDLLVTSSGTDNRDYDPSTTTTATPPPQPPAVALVLPRLRDLRLFGVWTIKDPVLTELLLRTCPNLHHLELLCWKGGSYECLFGLVRKMYGMTKSIRELNLNLHLTGDQMKAMDLYPPRHAAVKGREILPINVHTRGYYSRGCPQFQYVLLEEHHP